MSKTVTIEVTEADAAVLLRLARSRVSHFQHSLDSRKTLGHKDKAWHADRTTLLREAQCLVATIQASLER
jgi:hypothetical protein